MSEEIEVKEQIWEKFINLFGDSLPDPDHYPKAFEQQVKLFHYLNERGDYDE